MHKKDVISLTERSIPFIELVTHNPTPFDISPLLYHVGDVDKEPHHRHNFQELIWIKEGEGYQSIDKEILKIEPSMFYLIAKGQVHRFTKGDRLIGYVIRFTDDFFFTKSDSIGWDYHTTLFNLFTINQTLKIDKNELPRIEKILESMVNEFEHKPFGWTQLVRHLLSILLILFVRARRKEFTTISNVSSHQKIYQAFIRQLEKDFKLQHDVNHYAHLLNVTARALSSSVCQYAGKTAKRLILERIIIEAKRYLQHTNISVKEIAYNLGFEDPSYFSKIYKQLTGMNPSLYRKN